MTRHLEIRKASIVALIALITAACGSTLPQAQEGSVPATTNELGDLAGTLPPGAHVNEKGQVVNAQGEVIGSAEDFGLSGGSGTAGTAGGSGTTTSGGTSGVDGGGTSGSVDSPANGVTASSITLGLPVTEGVSALNQSLSGSNAASAIDYRRAWEAIVTDINKRGGIAGHKVEPVYHTWSAQSDKTLEQRAQEACADWTQDHEVFAALVTIETETFYECMENAGAAAIYGTSIRVFFDERIFPRYPHMILPFAADLNTQATALVDGLVQQRYFGKEAKIGLLTFDDPGYVYATEQNLIPALERHGLQLTDWVRLKRPQAYDEYGQFSSEAGSAAIKFKSEEITHVVVLDLGGNAAFFFAQAAERQQYRPRYGLTSQSGGTALADLLGNDANSQLSGARSIGWHPTIDLSAQDDPNSEANAPRKRCLRLMREAGVEMSSRNAESIAQIFCDQMWFTEAALEAGGRTITLDSFLAGVDRLGTSYVSAVAPFGTNLSASRHDGLGAVANMSYFTKCKCFRYTSKPRAIPN